MAELSDAKKGARAMWAGGEYAEVAERIAAAGLKAVETAEVGSGDRVLDVACGAGNATIPAARTGAEVTGLDLTPRLLEQGREAAQTEGVEIDWIEGDAEDLPFEDASFDVVMSVFGCMFAPDHRRTAAEIARVAKPGGRVAICAWSPAGSVGQMFTTVSKHLPPPPEGFQPPNRWGDEEHVREIFEGTGLELSFEDAEVVWEGESAEAFYEEYQAKLPPLVAARATLEPEGRFEALREDMLALYASQNEAGDGGFRSRGEYLVIKGSKG
jgi:ubiquinone/menaquinone biosynthesis C-methylase UbiE